MTDWSEHEFESVVDKAKALQSMVNIVEVAELLGLEPDHNGKIHSPFNDADHTPSCQLYPPDHFFCYSTGRGGDAIDLVQAITGKSWGQAVAVLWNRGLRAGFEPGRFEAVAKPPPADLAPEWAAFAGVVERSVFEQWADKLGLSWMVLDALSYVGQIRLNERELWIAHHDPAAPVVRGIKTRAFSGQKGSVTGSQYSHGLYRSPMGNWWERTASTAVIVEGESDCWTLSWHWRDEPVDVYALPCGAGVWREEWLQQLEPYASVHVCMDNDDAGKRARDKIIRSVGWERASEFRVPDLFNDVRAAYIGGWRPQVPRP